MANEIAKIDKIRTLIGSDYVQKKFMEILGERSSSFLASVLNVVQSNSLLSTAEPKSILTAAMASAVLNLPVDKNLGFAAIVPYKENGKALAQFQIMTRGYIQLAQRSRQYLKINVSEVYEDEFVSYNYVTGDLELKPSPKNGQRENDNQEKIVGYVAYFKLDSGFEKLEYWPVGKIDAHGKKFSKTFSNEKGVWNTNREAMRAKTVLKNTLAKWGPLSVDMQKAFTVDQGVAHEFDGSLDGTMSFDDNPENDIAQEAGAVEEKEPLKEENAEKNTEIKAEEKKEEPKTKASPEEAEFSKLERPDMVSKIVAVIESKVIPDEKQTEYKTKLKADLKPILKGQADEKKLIFNIYQHWLSVKAEWEKLDSEKEQTESVAPKVEENKVQTPLLKTMQAVRDAIEALPEEEQEKEIGSGGLGLF